MSSQAKSRHCAVLLPTFRLSYLQFCLAVMGASTLISTQAMAATAEEELADEPSATLDTIVVKAAKDELKQAAGLSIIGEKTLENQPVSNDIAEIVRKMPGVNLSGSSTSGQRGNQRQIDLRGMGPDNTLILIDGRPVTARNAIRLGRAGERDSRGDSQWVPPSAIERIEVLRGPAAARYGSGSMGGVVNIITKSPTQAEYSITGHYEYPENDLEGASWRTGVNMAGPINDKLSYRTTLGYHDSKPDDAYINADSAVTDSKGNKSIAAGREGVQNVDVRQLFEYAMDAINTFGVEVNFSNQKNRWAGDSQFQVINEDLINDLYGTTTNELTRYGVALTHKYDTDNTRANSYLEFNRMDNERLGEGLAGGGEGQIATPEDGDRQWTKSKYDTLNAKSEWDLYFDRHTVTAGGEFRGERLNDSASNQQKIADGSIDIPGTSNDPSSRDPISKSYLIGAYVEDNYQVTDDWFVTPGLRVDYHDKAGVNLSPSLNSTWHFSPNWSVKAGVSRAFKAPGLFQLNPNYVYYTKGNGCPDGQNSAFAGGNNGGGCYVLGNPDLDNETSLNKELTFTYDDGTGLGAGLTYYHNDYKNRIAAGYTDFDPEIADQNKAGVYRWENQGDAIIEGLEGFVTVPVTDSLVWNTNLTTNLRSERKDNGEALSLIPRYTVNTNVDWNVTPDWYAGLRVSYYGNITAPKRSVTTNDPLQGELLDVKPYAVVDVNTRYQVTDNLSLGAGVKNLFDETVNREGTGVNAGARTFNEPGRYYTASIKLDF